MIFELLNTGIQQVPPSSHEQPLEFVPEKSNEYGVSPEEKARRLRDTMASVAALAYNLGRHGNSESASVLLPDEIVKPANSAALFEIAQSGFEDAIGVEGQTTLTKEVTRHYLGRTMLLAGQSEDGLKEIRDSWKVLQGSDTNEDLFGKEEQFRVNVLGGVALAEATFGDQELARRTAWLMLKGVPKGSSQSEKRKRVQLAAGALGVVALRKLGQRDIAQRWGQNNLPSPIRHKRQTQ